MIFSLGLVVGIFLLILLIFIYTNEPKIEEEQQLFLQEPDVVMPNKVSRPGCEKMNLCYIPYHITIKKGQEVTWFNEDVAFHSVTSGFYDAPTDLFDSGHLDPFESYTLTFDESGTFDYFCTLHPWMMGQVIVE